MVLDGRTLELLLRHVSLEDLLMRHEPWLIDRECGCVINNARTDAELNGACVRARLARAHRGAR